jgi:uncharacterized membrane protein YccC
LLVTRALRHLLPDLALGVRAAIATVLPFFLSIELGRPELMWVALGGWLGAIADPGGARRTRAQAIFAFAVLGGVIVAVGMAATRHPPLGGIVLATVVFGGALARVAGGAASTLGTLLAVTGAIAVCARGAALEAGALFAVGASWAVVLSSMIWPIRTHGPLRVAIADVYLELSRYVDAIAAGEMPWAEMARTHQREIRAALQAAHHEAVMIRARRSGETSHGANLRVLLGEAELQFFDLIAIAEHVELEGPASVLAVVADRYRAIATRVLAEPNEQARPPDRARPAPHASARARLLERLDATSAALVELVGREGPPPAARLTPSESRGLVAMLRDAMHAHSPALRHGVQVAAAALVALGFARLVSPAHMSWVVVTTIGVLQPYRAATFGRVIERVLGTIIGCSIAAVLVTALRNNAPALSIAMVPLSAAAVITRPRSYRLFVLFLTPVFVLMSDHLHGSWSTLEARVGDVIAGGMIAAVAAALLPTWERERLPSVLGVLCDTLIRHADEALAAWSDGRYHTVELVAVRRDVGAALENAEASLERMLSEPARRREDPQQAVFLLTYGRRLSGALTTLDVIEVRLTPDEIAGLRAYLGGVLARARAVVTGEPDPGEPPEPPEVTSPSQAIVRLLEYARLVGQIGR